MVRLLVADGHRHDGAGLAAILRRRPNVQVVGVTSSVAETLQRLTECDVLLVSVDLPNDGALELVRTVSNSEPWIKVLVLGEATSHSEPYIDAGAAGRVF